MPGNRAAERIVLVLARIVGLVAALSAIVLYGVLLFHSPDRGPYPVAAAMVLLALVVIWGVIADRPVPVLAAFLLSLFPVGLYFLGTPGIFAWIGVMNVFYLVAGALLVLHRVLLTLRRTEERLGAGRVSL